MIDQNFIIVPVSGAIIGYFTNWLAIKMLFRPHKEVRVFGIRLPFTPGIIPKERYRLSEKVAETVSGYLLTKEAVRETLCASDYLSHFERLLDERFEQLKQSGRTLEEELFAMVPISREALSGGGRRLLEALSRGLLALIRRNLPKAGGFVETLLKDNPGLDQSLKALVYRVIEDNVSGLALLFLSREKVYNSIKENAVVYLNDEANQQAINRLIQNRVDDYFASHLDSHENAVLDLLRQNAGQVCSRISGEDYAKVKKFMLEALSLSFQQGAVYLAEALDVKVLVKKQIDGMDMMEGERLVLSVVQRELSAITALGGLLGFLIGVATVLIQI